MNTFKSILVFLIIFSFDVLYTQTDYEVVRYFNSLSHCSDSNAYMEDFDCVYLKVEYPRLLNCNCIETNDIILSFVYSNFFDKSYNNFNDYSKEFFEYYSNTQEIYEAPGWFYTIGIDTIIVSERIVSISLGSYKYMGGAHGVSKMVTLNYDKETRRILDFGSIVNEGSKSNVNTILNSYINSKAGDLDFFDPEMYNYGEIGSRFIMSSNAFIFKFDFYDEIYRKSGNYDLIVPYKSLQRYINPQYKFLLDFKNNR